LSRGASRRPGLLAAELLVLLLVYRVGVAMPGAGASFWAISQASCRASCGRCGEERTRPSASAVHRKQEFGLSNHGKGHGMLAFTRMGKSAARPAND
jgi:hypothetical protein